MEQDFFLRPSSFELSNLPTEASVGVKYILSSIHHVQQRASLSDCRLRGEALSLLKRRLDNTQFPDEINDANWAYGSSLADIRRLTERWRDGYDWCAHERELNALLMFTLPIEVQGLVS